MSYFNCTLKTKYYWIYPRRLHETNRTNTLYISSPFLVYPNEGNADPISVSSYEASDVLEEYADDYMDIDGLILRISLLQLAQINREVHETYAYIEHTELSDSEAAKIAYTSLVKLKDVTRDLLDAQIDYIVNYSDKNCKTIFISNNCRTALDKNLHIIELVKLLVINTISNRRDQVDLSK